MFMLDINIEVVRGIAFIRLEGDLTSGTFNNLNLEIDNLLYNLGMQFYVIIFADLFTIDNNVFDMIQNKLYEIFLSCGDVVMCGVKKIFKDKRIIYINSEDEAFRHFSI